MKKFSVSNVHQTMHHIKNLPVKCSRETRHCIYGGGMKNISSGGRTEGGEGTLSAERSS